MIVVDANVLIAHLDRDDALNAAANRQMRATAWQPFGASSLTLAEVLVMPMRTGRLRTARAALRALELTELPLPQDATERLAAIRAETGLRLPDCCVLLAAEAVNGGVLTFDERLARAAAERALAV